MTFFLTLAGAIALLATQALAVEAPWGPPPVPHYGFEELDTNRDGTLNSREARYEAMLARNFGYADRNGDSVLDRAEYDEAMAMNADLFGAGKHSLRKLEIFRSLDADGDASLSPTEAAPRPALERSFEHADTDGDGRLDRGEFAEVSLDLLGPQEPLPR